jgi:hypothetical protein
MAGVKLIAEYIQHALTFEDLAAHEAKPELKAAFEAQAEAYRKLAAERAKALGLPDAPILEDLSKL